jgi:hypothetical protein
VFTSLCPIVGSNGFFVTNFSHISKKKKLKFFFHCKMCVFQDNNNNKFLNFKLHFLLKRKLNFEGKKEKKKDNTLKLLDSVDGEFFGREHQPVDCLTDHWTKLLQFQFPLVRIFWTGKH